MSITFDKGIKIIEKLQNVLLDIKPSNGYNITIQNVVPYDILEFDRLSEKDLPAIFIKAEEEFEQDTNASYRSRMAIDLFIKFKPKNVNKGIMTDFSKLLGAIKKQIDANIDLGFSYVENIEFTATQHPLITEDRQAYNFLISLTIQYYFCASSP